MGPVATLTEMRSALLRWTRAMYQRMADENGFKSIADPFFPAIPTSEMTKLVQSAIAAVKLGKMSSDYMLQMFGTDFESEHQQIKAEEHVGLTNPVPEAMPIPVGPTVDTQQDTSTE